MSEEDDIKRIAELLSEMGSETREAWARLGRVGPDRLWRDPNGLSDAELADPKVQDYHARILAAIGQDASMPARAPVPEAIYNGPRAPSAAESLEPEPATDAVPVIDTSSTQSGRGARHPRPPVRRMLAAAAAIVLATGLVAPVTVTTVILLADVFNQRGTAHFSEREGMK